jgi:hypothetical protein
MGRDGRLRRQVIALQQVATAGVHLSSRSSRRPSWRRARADVGGGASPRACVAPRMADDTAHAAVEPGAGRRGGGGIAAAAFGVGRTLGPLNPSAS